MRVPLGGMTCIRCSCAVALLLPLSSIAASASEPIPIALIAPLTGGTSAQGIAIRNGAELAVREINAAGGVMGRPLLLHEYDDHSQNERGAEIAQKLTSSHEIAAAVGFANTGVTLAAIPYFEQEEIPIIVSAATGTMITRQFAAPEYEANYVFRVAAADSLQAEMIADEVARSGFRRVAVFHDTTSYGRLGRGDLVAALSSRHVSVAAEEKFNIGDTDMAEQLRRARASDAEIILTYGIGPELAAIANDRATLGWNVPIFGSWTLSMDSFIAPAGANAEGARMPQSFIALPDTPLRARFLEDYYGMFATNRISTPPAAAQSYDAMRLLAAAIAQAKSTDGPAIREALEVLQSDVEGLISVYRRPFTRENHEALERSNVVFGIVHAGRVAQASD